MSKRKSFDRKSCCFCGLSDDDELEYGKFYEHGDVVTHYYCLLLSSNMEQKGRDTDGILGFLVSDIQKEIRRGKRLVCSFCKKNGATLGCCNSKCKKIFHYPCGLRTGSLHQFFGEFRSYCQKHRPRQKIDLKVKNELERFTDIKCCICYDNVYPTDIINTIWAPCCKKNTWFHRKCVQQLAMSAGYFFKCPLCNNKKKFQKAMLEYGIFIPRQDASWELEPNAFQELLYRHDQCDAPVCLCPKGRKYTSFNAKWELTLCRTCGSQGIHMACGHLKWTKPTWECTECVSILVTDKSTKIINAKTPLSPLQRNNSNLDESESDGDGDGDSDDDGDSESDIGNGNNKDSDSDNDKDSDSDNDKNSDNDSYKDSDSGNDKDSDSDSDKDSDISVGKEMPMPYTIDAPVLVEAQEISAIKLRPGPRTFKLKQQYQIAKQMKDRLQKRSSRHQDIEKTNTILNVVSVEKCTNNKNTPSGKSNLHEDHINLENECCKSITIPSNNSVIMLDSDDDMNASTSSLNNKISIADIAESVQNNVFSLKNDVSKDKKYKRSNTRIQQSSSSVGKEVLDANSTAAQQHNNNDLGVTESDRLKENSMEDGKSIDLDDTICLSVENDCDFSNSMSNIQISNVISLTPEEFEDVSSIDEEQETNNDRYSLQKQSPRPYSSCSKNDDFKIQLKRRMYNVVTNSTNESKDESKKVRRSLDIQYEHEKQALLARADIDDITKSNILLNNTLTSISNTDLMRINRDNNVGNQLLSRGEQHSDENTDLTNIRTFNINYGFKENTSKISNNEICSSSIEERKGEGIRDSKSTSDTRNIERGVKICDADTGTSTVAVAKPGCRILTWDERIDSTKQNIRQISLQSRTADQWKSQTNIEMATISNRKTSVINTNQRRSRNSESDHYRLIPEYIRLCDLKFRVCNSNNLLMILYNKFSVNINMENSTVARKNAKFDVYARKTVQQKTLYDSTSTSIPKDKEKHGMFINDQSENYRDDAKENLDPISGSCKSLTDSDNNQSEDSSMTNSVYNVTKTIEEDSKWHHRENINLPTDTTNICDADELVTHANDKHFRSTNYVKQNLAKIGSVKSMNNNDRFDTTKSLCVNGKSENKKYVYVNGNGKGNETKFKISIDLKKIESFIDNNPQLFSESRRKNEKKRNLDEADLLKKWNEISGRISIPNKHIANSIVDESKQFGNFSLSLTGNRIAELKSYVNEDNNIKTNIETLSADSTESGTKYFNNSSFSHPKHDVKWTDCHFEKRLFNR